MAHYLDLGIIGYFVSQFQKSSAEAVDRELAQFCKFTLPQFTTQLTSVYCFRFFDVLGLDFRGSSFQLSFIID